MRAGRVILVTALVASGLVIGTGTAGAAASPSCTGTFAHPGHLSGHYTGNVTVTGLCNVDRSPVTIDGNLTVTPNSALNATFAFNDKHEGYYPTSLWVGGNLVAQTGAVLFIGCEPFNSPCTDDPYAEGGGEFFGHNHIVGNLSSTNAGGDIVHNVQIDGEATQSGGGLGISCDTPKSGPFHFIESPAFSAWEDNSIGGDLTLVNIQSCWLGGLRNEVGGNLTAVNLKMADPDANEILTNDVEGSMSCAGNAPIVQYGDSSGSPNEVGGSASGECSFTAMQPNPAPNGPLTPISVLG